jgi:hypothetical protein
MPKFPPVLRLISPLLDECNGLPTPVIDQEAPYLSAAGRGEQSLLPVAGPPGALKKLPHRPRVGAGQPLLSGHSLMYLITRLRIGSGRSLFFS